MKKYAPLFEHLCRAPDGHLEMSFDEIDALVGGLPASAVKHKVWWSNEQAGTAHVQAHAWINAGRTVEWVDQQTGRVRFSAARWRRGS